MRVVTPCEGGACIALDAVVVPCENHSCDDLASYVGTLVMTTTGHGRLEVTVAELDAFVAEWAKPGHGAFARLTSS